MKDLTAWMKSTRSIGLIIVMLGITVGLFVGKIESKDYINVAMIVVGAYYARRTAEGKE